MIQTLEPQLMERGTCYSSKIPSVPAGHKTQLSLELSTKEVFTKAHMKHQTLANSGTSKNWGNQRWGRGSNQNRTCRSEGSTIQHESLESLMAPYMFDLFLF